MQSMSNVHRAQRATPPIQSNMQPQELVPSQTQSTPTSSASNGNTAQIDKEKLLQSIMELSNVATRENSLLELR